MKQKTTKSVLEFVDYSKEYDTEKIMYDYFTELISSAALAKFMTPHRHIEYISSCMPKHLLEIRGFEEKVENFVSELNKALLIHTYDEICKYDLHDAFVNKTLPIIKNIVRV